MKKLKNCILVVFILLIGCRWGWSDNLKVHFIDVREGDAILVQYEGENYLIDSGRNLSSNKLINYVDSVGVSYLDACLLTHPDFDPMRVNLSIFAHKALRLNKRTQYL